MAAAASSNPTYAHGHSSETVKGHALRTVDTCAKHILPHLKRGMSVLDVGCGPGSITKGFAEIVSPGRVVGLDYSESVIQIARETVQGPAQARGLDNLEFMAGDVFNLPFPDESFDVVCANQVLIHLPLDRVHAALSEMRRVCKSGGGFVASRDGKPDRGGHQFFPWDPLVDKMMELVVKRVTANGPVEQQAPQIASIARQSGFEPDKVRRTFTFDLFEDPPSRQMWGEQWEKRSSEEPFRQYALENGLATEEELDGIPKAWKSWRENEQAWALMIQVETVCWK